MRHQKKLERKAELERYRQEQIQFGLYMKNHGWVPMVYFMRGYGWAKGAEKIVIDRDGIKLNGRVITAKEMYQYVQYKPQKQ